MGQNLSRNRLGFCLSLSFIGASIASFTFPALSLSTSSLSKLLCANPYPKSHFAPLPSQVLGEFGTFLSSKSPSIGGFRGLETVEQEITNSCVQTSLSKGGKERLNKPNLLKNSYQLRAQANQFCQENLDILITQLLQDLPSYTNRVIQRSKIQDNNHLPFILLTGKADLNPISLTQLQYQPLFEETTKQVFFTVLERHYGSQKAYQLQSFYWAFFTPTNQGWQLSQLKVQLATKNKNDPPLPPQDASQSAIAQGIRLWLRDCQAGTIPALSNH